jgi:hypothetical protein
VVQRQLWWPHSIIVSWIRGKSDKFACMTGNWFPKSPYRLTDIGLPRQGHAVKPQRLRRSAGLGYTTRIHLAHAHAGLSTPALRGLWLLRATNLLDSCLWPARVEPHSHCLRLLPCAGLCCPASRARIHNGRSAVVATWSCKHDSESTHQEADGRSETLRVTEGRGSALAFLDLTDSTSRATHSSCEGEMSLTRVALLSPHGPTFNNSATPCSSPRPMADINFPHSTLSAGILITWLGSRAGG